MYDCYKDSITEGRESFTIAWIIWDNLQAFIIWFLGAFLLWPLLTIASVSITGIAWILYVLILQILLKKHFCSGCYYYDKLCHLGWGKLSSALFEQNSGNPDTGMKLAVMMYMVPFPAILVASIIYGSMTGAGVIYWTALGLFVVINLISFPLRKKSCGECVMQKTCPGSACK